MHTAEAFAPQSIYIHPLSPTQPLCWLDAGRDLPGCLRGPRADKRGPTGFLGDRPFSRMEVMPHLVGEGVADGLSPLNVTARSPQSPALLLTEPPAARVPPLSVRSRAFLQVLCAFPNVDTLLTSTAVVAGSPVAWSCHPVHVGTGDAVLPVLDPCPQLSAAALPSAHPPTLYSWLSALEHPSLPLTLVC